MRTISLLLLACLALGACTAARPAAAPSAAAPPPASAPQSARRRPGGARRRARQRPVTIKMAANIGASDAGIFLAMDRGFFAEQGLEIDLTRGSSELVPSLANGDLDVLAPAVSAALLNAMARDIPLRIVATRAPIRPASATRSSRSARISTTAARCAAGPIYAAAASPKSASSRPSTSSTPVAWQRPAYPQRRRADVDQLPRHERRLRQQHHRRR